MTPTRSPAELKLSGFAKGPTTRTAKATLDMSQKYFARLSLCFSVRMIFMARFLGLENNPLPEGASMASATGVDQRGGQDYQMAVLSNEC